MERLTRQKVSEHQGAGGVMMDQVRTADFLSGGGHMGALIRAFDWATTPLGSPETWQQSLRLTARLMLNTNHLMFIWWGPDLIQLYNYAYRLTMGAVLHPAVLGRPGR